MGDAARALRLRARACGTARTAGAIFLFLSPSRGTIEVGARHGTEEQLHRDVPGGAVSPSRGRCSTLRTRPLPECRSAPSASGSSWSRTARPTTRFIHLTKLAFRARVREEFPPPGEDRPRTSTAVPRQTRLAQRRDRVYAPFSLVRRIWIARSCRCAPSTSGSAAAARPPPLAPEAVSRDHIDLLLDQLLLRHVPTPIAIRIGARSPCAGTRYRSQDAGSGQRESCHE